MSKYYISCPKCLEDIAKKNTRAARFWMDLCAEKLKAGDVFEINTTQEIKLLEKMGYVITTEKSKNQILLKLLGNFYERQENDVFCVKSSPHD